MSARPANDQPAFARRSPLYGRAGLSAVVMATAWVISPGAALAEKGGRPVAVQFAKGASSATLQGHLQGREVADFTLTARAGQTLTATLSGNNTVYFNLLTPGSRGEALFIGSRDGDRAQVALPSNGRYTLRVYQMGAAKDQGARSDFTLTLSVTGQAAAVPPRDAKVGATSYQATGKVPCALGGTAASCDFGVVRNGSGRATLHLQPQGGLARVLKFDHGQVTSDGATVRATLKGDTFLIDVNDFEHYEIPQAVIDGG